MTAFRERDKAKKRKEGDDQAYVLYQSLQASAWEALCLNCGSCCGLAEGDPCEHLRAHENGQYYCEIYDSRFGTHKSLSGREFRCVPIREIIHLNWVGADQCAYKNLLKGNQR